MIRQNYLEFYNRSFNKFEIKTEVKINLILEKNGLDKDCEAFKKLKGGKLPCIDEIAVRYLKKSGPFVLGIVSENVQWVYARGKSAKGVEECMYHSFV